VHVARRVMIVLIHVIAMAFAVLMVYHTHVRLRKQHLRLYLQLPQQHVRVLQVIQALVTVKDLLGHVARRVTIVLIHAIAMARAVLAE